MRDPVMIAETGQTYERANIERWLESHNTCPSTSGSLTVHPVQLIPNYSLRQSIDLWAKEQVITLPAAPVHVPMFAGGSPGASSSSGRVGSSSTAAAGGVHRGARTNGVTSSLPSPPAGSFGSFSSASIAVGGGRAPSAPLMVTPNVSPRSAGSSSSSHSPAYIAVDIPPEASAPPSFASGSTSYTPGGTITGSYTRVAAASNAAVAGSGPASSYYPVVDAIPGGYGIPEERFYDANDDTLSPDDQGGHARVDVSKARKGSTSGGAAVAGGAGGVGVQMRAGKGAGAEGGSASSTREAGGGVRDGIAMLGPTPTQMRRNRVCRTACAVVLIAIVILLAAGVGLGVAFYLKQTKAKQQQEGLLNGGAAPQNSRDSGK